MSNTKLTLECARQFLIDYGWTQNTYARDSENKTADHNGLNATCFCSAGAMLRAESMMSADGHTSHLAEVAFTKAIDGRSIAGFNDTTGMTKEQVIAKFDEAIQNAS